jgi:hypothetical protein
MGPCRCHGRAGASWCGLWPCRGLGCGGVDRGPLRVDAEIEVADVPVTQILCGEIGQRVAVTRPGVIAAM